MRKYSESDGSFVVLSRVFVQFVILIFARPLSLFNK